MAKGPTFSTITAAFASASKLNANNAEIVTAFDNTLSRDGSSPNTMTADFDMNSNDILNANNVNAVDIIIGGVSLITQVDAAATSATASASSATASASSATASSSSATASAVSAADSSASAAIAAEDVTRNEIELATIAASVDFLRTSGYAAIGDGGEAHYKRVVGEPSHALKITSLDGAFWEIIPENGRVNVLQAGAKGDDSTDDATALNNTATFCRGDASGGFTLVLPQLTYLVNSVLDFKEIRNIECPGEIKSSITSGSAVTIGTIINANLDMEGGNVQLFVRSSLADNSTLGGVIGVEVKGATRCNFRITAVGWDIGVTLRPDGGTGIQHIAFCDFIITGNRNHWGLKFDPLTTAFVNENTFRACQLQPAGDALAGDSVGVYMTGANAVPDNNVFLTLTCEEQDVPIWIDKGKKNHFNNVRLEVAGQIRFGTTGEATDKDVEDNTVLVNYIGDSPLTHIDVDWFATRPNYVGSTDGAITWMTVATVSYDDFFKVGSTVYSSKMINNTTGTPKFASGILDDGDRTFDPGSNHRGQIDIPCGLGDVFRIHFDRKTGIAFTMKALDASKADLGALTGGDTPYLGTNMTPNVSATSGTTNFVAYDNAAFRNPWMISINRSTVKFLRIQLHNAVTLKSILVEKLMRGGVENDIPARQLSQTKTIADMSVVPDYPGQLAFLTATRPLIGIDDANWLQIGGHLMYTAVAADIIDKTKSVNTINKTLYLQVYDTTNNRIMVAQGSTDVSTWIVSDGSTTITPV